MARCNTLRSLALKGYVRGQLLGGASQLDMVMVHVSCATRRRHPAIVGKDK